MLNCYAKAFYRLAKARRVVVLVTWSGMGMMGTQAGEAGSNVGGLAEQEVRRRSVLVSEADAQLHEGYLLLNAGKFQEAAGVFAAAYRSLPVTPLTAGARERLRRGYGLAAVRWSRELLAAGRYQEAENVLNSVLAADMDPENEEAGKLLVEMKDPDRFPRALTPQHVANTQQVAEWLQYADSKFELGDFDAAIETYIKVLRVDAYNAAARRGMERAEQQRAVYFDTARDHTRSKLLNLVSSHWEDAVPASVAQVGAASDARQEPLRGVASSRDKIIQKLRTLVVPKVDFSGASFDEVIEFLRVRSRDLDPEGRGVDFVLSVPPDTAARTIDLSLVNIPLEELVRYTAEKVGVTFKIDEFAVKFVSLTENSNEFLLRTYRVPPGFIETATTDAAAPAANDPFGAAAGSATGGIRMKRLSAKEFLESRGVSFPEGASASYSTASSQLVVRNTMANLDIVETLVEQAATSSPKQALISVKMIEVNQTNLEELGFDWLLGHFNVPGSDGVFGSGGTPGFAQPADGASTNFPGKFPGTDVPIGQFPMTSGLRSSGEILGRPTLDSLLGENLTSLAVNSKSPSQFAVTGVLTDPQFQVVVRALNQKKGVDLMAMPSIVAKSGTKASIDLSQEFRYPTEFDPPEIPQQVGQVRIGNQQIQGGGQSAPITPSTPTTFEMRKVGTIIEMEPVISDDGRDVEIVLTPETTEFEGFIDYASDINNTIDLGNGPISQPVDNRIIQPIFRTNKISTAVRVYDGSTVVLGGVIIDRRIKVEDKVPVIGTLPLVGRFWRSEVSQVEKKAFVVFVSVRVLDPSGQPVNQIQVTAGPAGP
jgi:general secretion pathway protein D